MSNQVKFFQLFKQDVSEIALPTKFTFPFFYEAHPLAKIASKELQSHLETQTDWSHDFGLKNPDSEKALGKMFGVLVVENSKGELGYLSAFSGKMADSNHLRGFVPPVFDILKQDGFYIIEGKEVEELCRQVDEAKNKPELIQAKEDLARTQAEQKSEIENLQAQIRENRKVRKAKRTKGESELNAEEYDFLLKTLGKESISEQYFLKDKIREWKQKVKVVNAQYLKQSNEFDELKTRRKNRSAELQRKIFDHYTFLNTKKESKSLMEIFSFLEGGFPPSGSGECAAPKLLHYAFLNDLKPICMAEFWWGKSPASAIRKHKLFYPSCRSKCEPILEHMLNGLELDENPILRHSSFQKEIETVYEDDAILIVNKPSGLLSVPGKTLTDSVDERMQKKYPRSKTPLIVHRLDMATSGLMLLAKTKEAHKNLQAHFIKRTVKKRYVALLDGVLKTEKGAIDLPLRLDLDNRPQQLVCEKFGKNARTVYQVIAHEKNRTRIHFFPITGRSHQLRVHASHPRGLNMAIIGDDLYGTNDERLMLHAEWLQFSHPITEELMEFEVKAEF